MGRTADMAARLPLLYQDGERVRGVLDQAAVQLEILGEDSVEVQRAHWFDTALELSEAARLAAVIDIAPESWQDLAQYRDWVHTLRDAMLKRGAVTRRALQEFVVDYAQRYQQTVGARILPSLQTWEDTPSGTNPAFVEFPRRRRYDRAPTAGGIEPLHQFTLTNRGLDETRAAFLLTGLPTAPESVPVIANVTTGQALIFLGNIPPGARLWLRPEQDGSVSGQLEGQDVTPRLRSVAGLTPGTAWPNNAVQQPAQALTLRRGANELWFLPIAHFDALGLDRFLLALADLLLREGRYDQTQFDHALFYQDPAVILRISWLETQPASFDIQLPAGGLRYNQGRQERALADRERLGTALNQAVQRLRAAGVQGAVGLRPFTDVQGQMDLMTTAGPLVHREVGPTGADRLPDAGGLFEVTHFEDSTYR